MAQVVGGIPKAFKSRLSHLEAIIMDPWDLAETIHDKVLKNTDTDSRWVDKLQLSGPGTWAERADGALIAYQDILQGWSKAYETTGYARGFDVTREMVDEDKDGIIEDAAKGLRVGAIATVETQAAALFNNAFATNGPDGVPLCSTAHNLFGYGGGTVANRPTTDVDLSVTTLRTAFQQFMQFKNEQGFYISRTPGTLLVHPNEYFNALEIIKSAGRPDTADRADNVVPPTRILTSAYLTDTDAWFLLSKDIEGLLLLWRRKMETIYSYEARRRTLQVDADMEFDIDFHDWRDVYGTSGG
ncbi:MAG: hypothetical protein QMD05_08855 [Candidatus Brocadiaceae bacterium]|nr:hypothetical protein [Candidatus Brocadiaceae bacterium]